MFSTDSGQKGTGLRGSDDPGRPVPLAADSVENRPVPSGRWLWILLLAAVPVLFLRLGANSVWDANEAFYVETPRQMVMSGDYVNPNFNDAGRFNKPVLSYWIVAGLYQVFGISVTVERIGIAFGALGIVLAAVLIGRATGGPAVGWLAGLAIITAPRFVFWSRRIFIDIYITLFMALTLAFFVLAERHPHHRRRFLLLTYAAMGFGVLTKGPVALVLPAAVLIAWLVSERRLADLKHLMLVPGALIVLAIVAPWYLILYFEHGWEHIVSFFVGENIGRFTNAMASEGRGLFFYLPVLLTDLFPWAPLVIVPLAVVAASIVRRSRSTNVPGDGIRRLLWWWVVVIVGAFSLSETKQDLYIFPVIPAVAALVADALFPEKTGHRRDAITWGLITIGIVTATLAVIVATFFGPDAGPWQLAGAVVAAAILGLTGVTVVVLAPRLRKPATLALAVGFVLFNYVLVTVVVPDLERFKPVPAFAQMFREEASPRARLAHFDQSLPSLVYYAGHPVEELPTFEAAAEALAGDRETWVLVPARHGAALRDRVPSACLALSRPVFDLTPRQIIARQPPPTVELLTNRCRSVGTR